MNRKRALPRKSFTDDENRALLYKNFTGDENRNRSKRARTVARRPRSILGSTCITMNTGYIQETRNRTLSFPTPFQRTTFYDVRRDGKYVEDPFLPVDRAVLSANKMRLFSIRHIIDQLQKIQNSPIARELLMNYMNELAIMQDMVQNLEHRLLWPSLKPRMQIAIGQYVASMLLAGGAQIQIEAQEPEIIDLDEVSDIMPETESENTNLDMVIDTLEIRMLMINHRQYKGELILQGRKKSSPEVSSSFNWYNAHSFWIDFSRKSINQTFFISKKIGSTWKKRAFGIFQLTYLDQQLKLASDFEEKLENIKPLLFEISNDDPIKQTFMSYLRINHTINSDLINKLQLMKENPLLNQAFEYLIIGESIITMLTQH